MLGKNSRAVYLNEFLQDQVEDIKKVDFDIFDNGATTRTVYEYEIQELNNSDFDIIGYDESLMIAFGLRTVTDLSQIHSIVLDERSRVPLESLYQSDKPMVSEDGEEYKPYFFIQQVKEPGSHSITITYTSGAQSTLGFYIKAIGHEETVGIDLPIISHRDALLNVTKLWLLSSKFDRVRQPDWAGFFDDRLRSYTMDESGARGVEESLKRAIEDKIEDVQITKVVATPKPDQRGWEVAVDSIDTSTLLHTTEATDHKTMFIPIEDSEDFVKIN